MANDKKELFKFVNNPKYRDKVIARIHKEADSAYSKKIRVIEGEKDKLSRSRTSEISRIASARWEKLSGGKVMVNRTEGKVKINNVENLFSSIQGAEINMISGARVVTTENTKTKSKKHASLGGAVVGGVIAGPIGAVAGGVGLGKTKGKTTGTTVSKQIPTCTHLGVMVNIDGFVTEVVLISSQVDQSSQSFSKAQSEAQTLVSTLGVLAKTPVPKSFLKPEEEDSVKNIDDQIEKKQQELQEAIADHPTYALPNVYRTEEQKDMTDAEYLQYLQDTDAERISQRELNKAAFKMEQAEMKAAAKAKREEDRIARKHQKEQDKANGVYTGNKVLNAIYSVVFWALSIAMLLFALVGFTSAGGVVSGMVFLITAVVINPLIENLVREYLFELPKWVAIIVFVIGFIVAIILFPSSDNAENSKAAEIGVEYNDVVQG
ncbi:MAG: hypothetical protein K6G65_08115 [Lachnospiraceae bacterium]|nr:hypothetical protein [Lachnospiraceae bacterium]